MRAPWFSMTPDVAPDAAVVGPILAAGRVADAIIAAIRKENVGVRINDRGSYLRVLVPGGCRVSRAAIELELAQVFRLPSDLEQVMPSFAGRFQVSENEAAWIAGPTDA